MSIKPGPLSFSTAAQALRYTVLPVIAAADNQTDQDVAKSYADTLLYWLEACAAGGVDELLCSAKDAPSVKGGMAFDEQDCPEYVIDGIGLARSLVREPLHGSAPIETTMVLAAALAKIADVTGAPSAETVPGTKGGK